MQETYETWVGSLGQEDLLEKEMATHSSILTWKIPWTAGYSLWGHKELDTTEQLHFLSFCRFRGHSIVEYQHRVTWSATEGTRVVGPKDAVCQSLHHRERPNVPRVRTVWS